MERWKDEVMRMTMRVVGMVVAVALASSQADAALVICQKGKKIKLRQDACTSKETQVAASELGVVGPQGPAGSDGPAGPAGSARAYAQVDTSPALVAGRTLNFDAVTRINTGVYCLTPTPGSGVDPAAGTALAAVEWGASSGSDLLAFVQLNVLTFSCAATEYEVRTYNNNGGTAVLSNGVAFTLLVP